MDYDSVRRSSRFCEQLFAITIGAQKKITRTNVRSTVRLGSHTLTGWHASVLTAPSLRSAQVRASAFGDKKKKRHELWFVSFLFGSECWARTSDNLINSQVLCQLS